VLAAPHQNGQSVLVTASQKRRTCHGSRLADVAASVARRLGGSGIGVLIIGRLISPLQRRVYRLSNGRVSLTGRAPVLLLTTVGRRTGKPRTVPLFYVRDGEKLVVCNVNPGFERPNPWPLNLNAHSKATVELRGQTFDVEARAATSHEVERIWPDLTRLWPAYQRFYDRSGQRAVFVLTPSRGDR
jgi:F420H(2)-dependent quinone reductase